MTTFADIESALRTAWAGVLPYPTAYEGRDFTPPDNAPWCALYTLPASSAVAGLGQGAPIEHVVLQQADVNWPLNSGVAGLLADADIIAAAFDPGRTVTYNGLRMMVERCERSSIRRNDSNLTVSMTIRWRGQQHRA